MIYPVNSYRIIQAGVYPDSWKLANFSLIHKKLDKRLIKNSHPISLIPFDAKVFERILFDSIYNYPTSNELISPNQSGFCPGDSTVNQLLYFVHKIHFRQQTGGSQHFFRCFQNFR